MGFARKSGNGGNNVSAKSEQRRQSREQQGHGVWGWAGHHSYPKSRGKRNPTGASTHAPKEWGRQNRKQEEHMTGLAKQAEIDAIEEGLDAYVPDRIDRDHYFSDLDSELLESGLDAGTPGVMFNGVPLSEFDNYDDYDDYDYDDECPTCGRHY